MKKTKLVLTLALGGLLVSTGALNAAAAPGDGTTDGTVQFGVPGPDEKGEITKPGTDEDIIEIPVDEGNHTTGPLRLTFVPSFKFGEMSIASETKYGQAKFIKYTDKGAAVEQDIAHFAQVEDLRGGTEGWTLKVSAGKFTASAADGGGELENSAIRLGEAKLYNTRIKDATVLGDTVEIFTPNITEGHANETLIKNTGEAFDLMNTKTGKNTNSSKTSLVFNNDYEPLAPATGVANTGVQLRAVGSDLKEKGITYTVALTWTLETAP